MTRLSFVKKHSKNNEFLLEKKLEYNIRKLNLKIPTYWVPRITT